MHILPYFTENCEVGRQKIIFLKVIGKIRTSLNLKALIHFIVQAACIMLWALGGTEYSRSICNTWAFQNSTEKLLEYVHSRVHILHLRVIVMREVPVRCSGAAGWTPQHSLSLDYCLTQEPLFSYLQHALPSAAVALPDDHSAMAYTRLPCSSVWPSKQRSLVRLLLGWADIMHRKGAGFYISVRPSALCFIFVIFSSYPTLGCWIKNV